jgi:hypothetical protein
VAEWPTAEALKRVVNFEPGEDDPLGLTLENVRLSAIAWVKAKVGSWDDSTDEPDENLSQAALRMAELIALRPETAATVGESDPTIARLLLGRRRRFGISTGRTT